MGPQLEDLPRTSAKSLWINNESPILTISGVVWPYICRVVLLNADSRPTSTLQLLALMRTKRKTKRKRRRKTNNLPRTCEYIEVLINNEATWGGWLSGHAYMYGYFKCSMSCQPTNVYLTTLQQLVVMTMKVSVAADPRPLYEFPAQWGLASGLRSLYWCHVLPMQAQTLHPTSSIGSSAQWSICRGLPMAHGRLEAR